MIASNKVNVPKINRIDLYFVGVQYASSNGNMYPVYSRVNFCKTDGIAIELLPHSRIWQGVTMDYTLACWTYFFLPYDLDGWNYVIKL